MAIFASTADFSNLACLASPRLKPIKYRYIEQHSRMNCKQTAFGKPRLAGNPCSFAQAITAAAGLKACGWYTNIRRGADAQ